MNKYILQNLKKNMSKFIVMFVMLSVCSTIVLFTLDLVSNLTNQMNTSIQTSTSKEDMESMIFMLNCGVLLLLGIIVILMNNTYSIVLSGRKNEFELLNRLGYHKKKIRLMLLKEGVVLSIVGFSIGCILSIILSNLFMDYFDFKNIDKMPIESYVIIAISFLLIVIFMITKNLKNLENSNNGYSKKIITYNSAKFKKLCINGFLESALVLIVLVIPIDIYAMIYSDDPQLLKTCILAIATIIAINGWIVIVLLISLKIAKKRKWNSLYLAIEQNLFNFDKVKSMISSVIFAVALFVGFQGLYYSIEETTRTYIVDSMNYDSMIMFKDVPSKSIDEISSQIDQVKKQNSEKTSALALTIDLKDKKERNFTLTGIDENYYQMQKFYMVDNKSQDEIFTENGDLNVLFPSKKASDSKLKVGDKVNEYNLNGNDFGFHIGSIYKPVNLKQAFTSREQLSKKLFDTETIYNTIYLNGFTKEETGIILSIFNKAEYEIYDMSAFIERCLNEVVKGTEMIEIILYAMVLFVTFLIINLFILSYSDRAQQFKELKILGVKNRTQIKSMLFESGFIFIVGSVIGIILAVPFIEIALKMTNEKFVFETSMQIPWVLTIVLLMVCFITILLSTYIISRKILRKSK